MALIHCPECQAQVSNQAPACPQCGYPIAAKLAKESPSAGAAPPSGSRITLFAGAVVTLVLSLALILFVVLKKDTPEKPSESAVRSDPGAAQEPPPKEEEPAAGSGEDQAAEPPAEAVKVKTAAARADNERAAPPPKDMSKPENRYGPGKKIGSYWVIKDIAVDLRRKLYWQRGASKRPLTWSAAYGYCKKLSLGGFSDWELPSIHKLQRLLKGCSGSGQCGHPRAGIRCRHCRDNGGPGDKGWYMQKGVWKNPKYPWYWASTRHKDYKGYHWSLFPKGAYINYYKNSEPYHARCVRAD